MPEASMNVAAPGQPHNNNHNKKKAEAKNTNTASGAGNTPKLPTIARSLSNNFELDTDNDNWPEVDLGNIIIGLDEDIDKTMSNASTPPAGPAGTVSLNRQSGNSASVATLTETITATDKSLKMKIKRSKSGSRGHIEGKMEIIQTNDKLDDPEGSPRSSVSNGSPDPARLNAAEIVAAVKQSTKNTGSITGYASANSSGKFRLTTQGTNSGGQQVQAQAQQGLQGSGSSKKVNLALVNNGPRAGGEKSANGSSSTSSTSKSGYGEMGNSSSNSEASSSSGSGSVEGKVKQVTASHQTPGTSKGQGANFLPQKQNSEPPNKRLKMDASVGTEMGTMTEPECLGPLDPGTSVTLEGIVWHETDGGVLVINVTWRGKTYVGTLLDSTKHVNQWAPPRYSESPTSELDGRTPKGRSKRNRGTPVEVETRKNLRSSKVKTRTNLMLANSPAKRKGRPGEGGDEKRPRNDSSRNSPDDDDDSEKEQRDSNKEKENESDRESTSSAKVKEEKDEDFTPKDKEEEKYVPPPPLPFALLCPKSGCSKRYRHHNGLRYHVSHSHPELLNDHGEIKGTDEIQKAEQAEKDKEMERQQAKEVVDGKSEAEGSAPAADTATDSKSAVNQKGDSTNPEPNKKVTSMPAPANPFNNEIPSVTAIKPIRPPSNARPIVPATGPQVMAGEAPIGSSASNLKPIQPKPTIMADPSPNLSLEELRKAKKEMKKKTRSPASSPTRNGGGQQSVNGAAGKIGFGQSGGEVIKTEKSDAKSPAYSDISDDNEEGLEKRRGDHNASLEAHKPSHSNSSSSSQPPSGSLSVGNLVGPSTQNSSPAAIPPAAPVSVSIPSSLPAPFFYPPYPPLPLPGVPPQPKSESMSPKPVKKEHISMPPGPIPGSLEYQKMLEAYGFPPFPYPIPPGVDPTHHFQLITGDPAYKAKYERERSEKERAFKEQIDRDNREKERRANSKMYDEPRRTPEDLRKHGGGSRTPNASPRGSNAGHGINVKPEFRSDIKPDIKPPATIDEGVKPTMETRGPPPSNAYNFFHPAFFRPPGMPFDPILQHSLLSLPSYAPNPYLSPHMAAAAGYRPPFPLPGTSPEDLSRPSSATKALDLLHQHASHASQYYNSMANNVSAGLGSPLSAHKIHELHERALKSPSSGKSSPAPSMMSGVSSLSQLTSLSTGTTVTAATNTKSSTDPTGFRNKDMASPSLNPARLTPTSRGRSPPPLRHVHTHTHTHYGLGYPLLPPPGAVPPVPGVAPPAHTPFPSPGFPPSLLPGKPGGLPTFQPK